MLKYFGNSKQYLLWEDNGMSGHSSEVGLRSCPPLFNLACYKVEKAEINCSKYMVLNAHRHLCLPISALSCSGNGCLPEAQLN